jgi:hypothetical protein
MVIRFMVRYVATTTFVVFQLYFPPAPFVLLYYVPLILLSQKKIAGFPNIQ